MKKNFLFFILYSAFSILFPTQVLGLAMSDESAENVKNFNLSVDESGSYHVRFWLQPALYADGTYTTFKVYLNDDFIGFIKPEKANWQSVAIDSKPTLNLKKGENIISVSTKAPEIPEVEAVNFAFLAEDAEFSSGAYDSYIQKAKNPMLYSALEELGLENDVVTTSGGPTIRRNIPLKYSFYKLFTFKSGEEVIISTTSDIAHRIDMFYFGELYDTIRAQSPGQQIVDKPILAYRPASPLEIYRRTWSDSSKVFINNPSKQSAVLKAKITHDGAYMIKLRSKEDRALGVADINVNGEYYFEDVPVYYAFVEGFMDTGTQYGSFTMCDNPDVDDPLLFVTEKDNKILAYNDDAPADVVEQYDLGKWDSYIKQYYFSPVWGLHISSHRALVPESKCMVMSGVIDGSVVYGMSKLVRDSNGEGDFKDVSTVADNRIALLLEGDGSSASVRLSSSRCKIIKTDVFNMCGVKIASNVFNQSEVVSPLSVFNICNPGLYIFHIETEEGIEVKKIMVR